MSLKLRALYPGRGRAGSTSRSVDGETPPERSQSSASVDTHIAIQAFIQCCFGTRQTPATLTGSSTWPNSKPTRDAIANAYIAFIESQLRSMPTFPLVRIMSNSPSVCSAACPPHENLSHRCSSHGPLDSTTTQTFRALSFLAKSIQSTSQWSLHDGINALVIAGVLHTNLSEADIAAAAQLVFVLAGWITMLFVPVTAPASASRNQTGASLRRGSEGPAAFQQDQEGEGLRVDVMGTRRFVTSWQPLTKAERPLVEVLKGFGEILPKGRSIGKLLHQTGGIASAGSESDTLEVANLNMATLINVGQIEVVWVKSISSHLDFDRLHRRLSLFCVPSFCMLSLEARNLNNTPCESILHDFYDDEYESHFAGAATNSSDGHSLFQEILLSYKLLFADDARARDIFRGRERKRATTARGSSSESCLDELCGMNMPRRSHLTTFLRSPLTVSYSKSRDFPLLDDRLSELQSYISAQQPNRLTALWHDRRNLLSWYTFWMVLLFGLVGIASAVAQTILQIAQTIITWKS